MSEKKKPVELRYYQTQANDEFWSRVDAGTMKRGLNVAATGTGKTVTMAKCLHTMYRRMKDGISPKKPIVLLAHREELIAQAQKTFMGLMPYLSIQAEMGEQKATATSDVVIASVATVGPKRTYETGSYKRLPWLEDRGGAGLLFIDEVHHSTSAVYMNFAERLGVFSGDCLVWGTTATPQRMDRKSLIKSDGTAILEEEFYNYGLIQAIQDGYLCPIKGKLIVTDTDLSGVRLKGGDYEPNALSDAVDTEERTAIAYKHWKELAGDRLTIGFCASVAHAQHSASYFVGQGTNAGYVSGETPPADRLRILRDFREGRLRVVFNCGVLTEGFDLPAISCVLMLRPTKSGGLYSQCIGRSTRTFGGDEWHPVKGDALILDCTDNSLVHRLDDNNSASRTGNQSLSSLVGLPAGIDLEGQDILTAKAAWDSAEAEGRHTDKVKSLSGLKTAARTIDLLGETKLAPEVQKHSCLAWAKIGAGYLITAPPRESGQGRRVARLTEDSVGHWKLQIGDEKNAQCAPARAIAGSDSGVPEFASADATLLSEWGDAKGTILANVKWRQDGISEKQAAFFKKAGVPDYQIEKLNKGQAGLLMAQLGKPGGYGRIKMLATQMATGNRK